MTDIGMNSEDEVVAVCRDSFLRDFVIASPMFITESGHQREAADALLPCGDTLIALQVKTRTTTVQQIEPGSPELDRILKRVEAAVDQVKTIARALDAESLQSGTTLRGVKVPLSGRQFSKTIGLLLFDVFDSDGNSIVEQVEMSRAFAEVRQIPVHVFRLCDFRVIADEQDTLPDLLNYLNTRETLYRNDSVMPLTSELDLFGLFKVQYPVIEEAISDRKFLLIEPDLWLTVRERFAKQWAERDERVEPSYIVDRTIEEVHTCIGYDPTQEFPADQRAANDPRPETTGREYWHLIHKLGAFSRIERAQLGKKMLEKARAADSKPFAYTYMHRMPEVEPIVYLCSNEPRHERIARLKTLVKAACAHSGSTAASGICTQSYSSADRSHDFIAVEDVEFLDPDEAVRSAAAFFAAGGRGTSLDEWGKDYAADA